MDIVKRRKWLVRELRRIHIRYIERNNALQVAKRIVDDGFYKNGKKKTKVKYECADCGGLFDRTEVDVDHIDPVGSTQFLNWDDYINKLFCSMDNLQILCKPCHKRKTKKDVKEIRKKRK